MVTMEEALAELRALTARYREPSIQDPLRRLSDDQGSEDIEEWAKKLYISKRDFNNERSVSLNLDRLVILDLIYELVDLWNKVHDELGTEQADKFEDSIIKIFKVRRIEHILSFGVVMDRAQALHAMKIPTSSKYGMHWYSKFHFNSSLPYCNYDYSQDQTEQERQEWSQRLEGYLGRPTMNRRLFQLLFSKKLDLQHRFPALESWSKPQATEFVERPNLSDPSLLDSMSLDTRVVEDVPPPGVARNNSVSPVTVGTWHQSHIDTLTAEAMKTPTGDEGFEDKLMDPAVAAFILHGKVPHPSSCRFSPSSERRIFLGEDEIADNDIFCGRDLSQSNKEHPGNKAYLEAVEENKADYNSYEPNSNERRALCERIISELGGRFIRKRDDGKYEVLTEQKAITKVGDALLQRKRTRGNR